MSVIRFIVAYATPIMVLGVLSGIVFQPLAALVRPLLLPLIVATLSVAIMRTDFSVLGNMLRRPAPSIAQVVWLLVVSPLAVYAAVLALPVPEVLHGPLVLYAAAPPITSMPAFALLFGLDASFVLIGVSVSSLLAPLTVPMAASLAMGDDMTISAVQLALRLAYVIGLSFLIGAALQRVLGPLRIGRWKLQLDAMFVLATTMIGIAIMDGIVAMARANPAAMATIVCVLLLASFSLFAVATLLFLPAGKTQALGAGLNSAPRSIAMVLAVLGAGASDELVMVVAAAQLPIFLFPLFQRPLIRRLLAGPSGGTGGRAQGEPP